MTSVPQNKDELLSAIQTIYNKLYQDYATIPEEITRELSIEGNVKDTLISVSDTLAYLIGWGKLIQKWHSRKSQGLAVDFPETGYKWNELGQLAQSFHKQYHDWGYKDLLTEFESTISDIVALISSLDNRNLYEVPWYEKWTLGRLIQLNTSSPMKNMRTKVRKFKKANGLK